MSNTKIKNRIINQYLDNKKNAKKINGVWLIIVACLASSIVNSVAIGLCGESSQACQKIMNIPVICICIFVVLRLAGYI